MSRPSLCVECHLRWRQDRSGLCRQCRHRLEREHADFNFAEHIRAAAARQAAPPRPRREVVVNGRRYVVVWDGTVSP